MAPRKLASRLEASIRFDFGQPGRRDLRGGRYSGQTSDRRDDGPPSPAAIAASDPVEAWAMDATSPPAAWPS